MNTWIQQQRTQLGINPATMDRALDEVDRVRHRVAQLEAANKVGNITYGGPIKTVIATSVYTVGPFVRDLSAAFPAEFDLLVPDNILRLIRCQIRIKPKPIRSSVDVAVSGATTPSGGGATSGASSASTSGSTTHQHSGSIGSSGAHQNAGTTGTETGGYPSHTHIFVTDSGGAHTHSFATDNETAHVHGIAHTHSTPNHTHPSHDHALTLAISEGGSATSVRLYIDNVDRSAALGGPWSAPATVDITRYLLDSLGRPVLGVHPIKFTSTTVGAIEAFMDFYVIAKPIHQW